MLDAPFHLVHPQLSFITHIPTTVLGEQLISQLFRGIPDKQWLFQYGRVPLCFIMSSRMWKRLDAPMGGTQRCKVGVMGAATSEITELLPFEATQPFKDHFHPVPYAKYAPVPSKHPDTRRVGNPYQVVLTVPREFQAIQPGHLDYWDYCLRKMFVQKATPLKISINSLGPGAATLLKKLTDHDLPPSEQVDIRKSPNGLNVHEWSLVVKAFVEWPFAPEDLSIDTVFSNTNEHR
jgi:transcription factor 1